MNIKTGQVLIASPKLSDPNFERSVILICDQGNDGTLGLVLNQATANSVNDVMDDIPTDFPLFVGGPVEQNTLQFIHKLNIPNAIPIGDGLYWNGDFEVLKSMINLGLVKSDEVRFFLGYSGWNSNQLVDELKEKSWVVTSNDTDLIFKDNVAQFWRSFLRKMGGDYKVMANYPLDPRLN